MKIKGFSWVGIASDDFSRTFAFFTEVLGLSVATLGDDQAILSVAPGQQLEIFGRDGRGKRLNRHPTIAFEVEDVEAAKTALIAGGAEIIGEMGRWNGHEWLYFRTPDGHLFAVKRSPADRPIGN